MGFRYRLHDRRLPGSPDLYFPKHNAAIFVNGCFWHRHHCTYFKWPTTRPEFWKQKLEGNVIRDAIKQKSLEDCGLRVLVIWECALRGWNDVEQERVVEMAASWLNSAEAFVEIPER
jgi:DNA mismatch endonuclease (patch repair protein)